MYCRKVFRSPRVPFVSYECIKIMLYSLFVKITRLAVKKKKKAAIIHKHICIQTLYFFQIMKSSKQQKREDRFYHGKRREFVDERN